MREISERAQARRNRPWRRWLRRRLWFMTARGRQVHRIKAMLAEIVARASTPAPTTPTETGGEL